MGHLVIFIIWIIPIIVAGIVLYMVYKWVTRFLALKEEQNSLLREIVNKME